MQDEEVDPLGHYLICLRRNDLLKETHLIGLKRCAPYDPRIAYPGYSTIHQDYLCTRLASLEFSVNMHRLMFVCVEHHNQPEVFIELWHGSSRIQSITPVQRATSCTGRCFVLGSGRETGLVGATLSAIWARYRPARHWCVSHKVIRNNNLRGSDDPAVNYAI